MECEICDKNSDELYETKVQGAVLLLCKECSRFGEVIKTTRKKRVEKRVIRTIEPEESLIGGYGESIRKAREQKGMTQEKLGREINEPSSLIKRVENENIRPTENLQKKLEKTLGVTLTGTITEIIRGTSKDMPLTLGDIIRVKKTKK